MTFTDKVSQFAQDDIQIEFRESLRENNIKSFLYHIFFLFEEEKRDLDAIVNCFAEDGFEILYPWGSSDSKEDLIKWVSNIDEKSEYAHHIQDIQIKLIDNQKSEVKLNVIYQTLNEKKELKNIKLHYNFELVEKEEKYIKIKKYSTVVIK